MDLFLKGIKLFMVKIKMAGIDHSRVSLEDRELFAFSSHACISAMRCLKEMYFISCVLLSTCNRTELWVSYEQAEDSKELVCSPFEMLCSLKQISMERFQDLVMEREGEEAVMHLFRLSCGMQSKVFGEDQILTQVKNALSLARESETVDSVLERLFQTAITAGKKVKTEIHFTKDTSVVEIMIKKLYQLIEGQSLKGTSCLVIGNGEMGRLAATRLLEEGAFVTMTLRQYKHNSMIVPYGCNMIAYQKRLIGLGEYDVIVSATSSPHYTLEYKDAEPLLNNGKRHILFDLAVPRDISEKLSELSNVTSYNIDCLGENIVNKAKEEKIKQAEQILFDFLVEYKKWYYFREFVPAVYGISRTAVYEIEKRLEKPLKKLDMKEKEKVEFEKKVTTAVEHVLSSMLYDLREHLDMKYWNPCFQALEASIMEKK